MITINVSTFDDSPGYAVWNTFKGNDSGWLITFPFDTATYTFSGAVYLPNGTKLLDMTTTKITTGTGTLIDPYVYKCNFAMTKTQIDSIPDNCSFRLAWIQGGITNRTFIAGPINVGDK